MCSCGIGLQEIISVCKGDQRLTELVNGLAEPAFGSAPRVFCFGSESEYSYGHFRGVEVSRQLLKINITTM